MPATLDVTKAMLTRQASDDGQIIPIPASQWAFANCEKIPFPGEPDPTHYTESTDGHTWANWRIYLNEFTPSIFK